ncbi:hypothetical protein EAE99_008380 [Botrytis elliptica]|nr:hypothetical protein EAE99_008380 [Botrytis elliptica]
MIHPLGGYRDPGMKRIIVPKNEHNYPAKVLGVMLRLVDNRSLGVYQWAKSLDAQALYFLQEDDEDFRFVSEASLNQLVWGGDEVPGSLEDINEAHKKGFNESRNFTIKCFQQDLDVMMTKINANYKDYRPGNHQRLSTSNSHRSRIFYDKNHVAPATGSKAVESHQRYGVQYF